MIQTKLILSAAAFVVVCQGLSNPLSAATGNFLMDPSCAAQDTLAEKNAQAEKTLIGKTITSKEVLVYRTPEGDKIVTAGAGDSHTVSTYKTRGGDTLVVENDHTGGKRKIRIAFPGENGKDVALIRRDTVVQKDEGNFQASATYKTFRGDTILMEDIKTGEKRKVRIIFPGVDGKTVSVESETAVLVLDSTGRTNERTTSSPRSGSRNPHPGSDRGGSTFDKSFGITIKRSPEQQAVYRERRSKAIFGITFSRIDLGLTRLKGGGGFAAGSENEILAHRSGKTTNFGFDVFQMGRRVTPQFRVFLSAGFDWTYIRLKQGLEFDRNRSPYAFSSDLPADFSKNRLTSTYLRVPLTFEVKGPRRNSTRLAFGPMTGFLLKGTQRYKLTDDKTAVKRRGDYGFAPFQYGVFARLGNKHMGVYGKYYFNDMFENSPAGAGLQNFTFGLTAAF